MKCKILIVEDIEQHQIMLRAALESEYEIEIAPNVQTAISLLQKMTFDLAILDVTLPDGDGYQVCSYLKSLPSNKQCQVIFLSNRDQVDDKVQGLNFGGDDYVPKPFHLMELRARVKARLRSKKNTPPESIQFHGYNINLSRQLVLAPNESEVSLTKIEFKLLVYLCTNVDRVVTREQILSSVWSETLHITERTVDTHLSNLRKKIPPLADHLRSIHGVGYRLVTSKAA